MRQQHMGEIIRELRKKKGVTQEQLAEILDVSVPAVSKWECGQTNPELSALPILARYFEVSLDFLFGFSKEPSDEEINSICEGIAMRFAAISFAQAEAEWLECIRQYPGNYQLMYQLAMIALFHMARADSEEESKSFARKILGVFEQCKNSDDIAVKQGAYFQMINMYIAIDEFDKAQATLDEIPPQPADPKLLQSTLYIRRGAHDKAIKTMKESMLQYVAHLNANLSMLISAYQEMGNENTDTILDLHEKRLAINTLFGMESLNRGSGLEIAHILAQRKEYEKLKAVLEQEIRRYEQFPIGQNDLDTSFFEGTELQINQQNTPISESLDNLVYDAYRKIVEEIFSNVEEDADLQDIRLRLEKVLF
jgi:transcriptional regulator with XRE-family HTH domain